MSKKLLFILPIFAILLAGCGTQVATESATATAGGNAGIIENNPVDDVAAGDLNPTDDQLATANSAAPVSQATTNNQKPMSSALTIDQNKTYTAVLHTSEGDITVALNAKATPITVNNFVTLAKKAFYNGTIFHRVIKDFMIQGGDPTGTGSGGPGYQFADEPFTGEYTRGTLAMANAGPNTNGSQFFIMHADVPLSKDYVIFGHVTKGIEVVDKIANTKTVAGGDGAMSKPAAPITIKSVEVTEK